MTRKLKALGLALVAVCAISAAAASSASAVVDHFTFEGTPTTLTAAQVGTLQFKVAGQFIECTTVTLHATATGTSVTEVPGISPTFSGCTFAGNSAPVTMNGCTFTASGVTDENAKKETHATASVVCSGSNRITIDLPSVSANCELTIIESGASNGSLVAKNGFTYTNAGSGTTKTQLIHLTATVPLVGDNCPSLTGNGILTGTVQLEGEGDGTTTHTGIEVS